MNITYKLTLSDVLQELITSAGISEAELARKICIPTATLNKLKTGRIEDPRTSTLTIIANYFGLSVDQLLGNAPIEKNIEKSTTHVPVVEYKDIMTIKIDQLNFANHHKWISIDMLDKINKDNIFAVKVQGSAMEPYFDQNTLAIIDSDIEVENQQYALIYIKKTNEIILRQVLIDGETKILKPCNNAFDSIKFTVQDTILGVVVYSMKEYV